MKNLIIVLLLMFTFFTCEKDTSQIDFQGLEGENLYSAQLENSELYLFDEEIVHSDNDKRAPKHGICGGLIFYPNGNTPPCLVRHKMTYLDEEYNEVNEPDNTVYFVLSTVHQATGQTVCSVQVGENDSLGLYTHECILPIPGIYTMTIYRYVVSSSGVTSSRRICTSCYWTSGYTCE